MNPIFECYDARLNTLEERPTLRAATHEQLMEHHNRFEVLNAAKIVERFGTDPNPDPKYAEHKFYENACFGMLREEDFRQQCGLTFAWIDEHPVWLSPTAWDLEVLPAPSQPMQRQFRFSLIGGGQIRVREAFQFWGSNDHTGTWCPTPELRVTADVGEGLRRYDGIIDGGSFCDMTAAAALFRHGTPQTIADRVAATFRLLNTGEHPTVRGPDRDRFMALLDRGERCCVCRRPLRDEVSKTLGIGPDCARRMHLPHNLTTANRVLKLRRELLGCEQ